MSDSKYRGGSQDSNTGVSSENIEASQAKLSWDSGAQGTMSTSTASEISDSDSDDRYDLTLPSQAPRLVGLDYRRSLSTILQSESDGASQHGDGDNEEFKKNEGESNNIPIITVASSDTSQPLTESIDPAPSELISGEVVPTAHTAIGNTPDSAMASKSNMIVETETVPAVATVAVTTTGNLNNTTGSSSLKIKKSTDNVTRNSNRKKKKARQPLGSKAEIFAAKIASAVDEAAHSSDSDETFVYESNPPESQRPKWSRNPSSSSLPLDPYQTLTGTRRSKLPLGQDEDKAAITSMPTAPSSSVGAGVNLREKNEVDYFEREKSSIQTDPTSSGGNGTTSVNTMTMTTMLSDNNSNNAGSETVVGTDQSMTSYTAGSGFDKTYLAPKKSSHFHKVRNQSSRPPSPRHYSDHSTSHIDSNSSGDNNNSNHKKRKNKINHNNEDNETAENNTNFNSNTNSNTNTNTNSINSSPKVGPAISTVSSRPYLKASSSRQFDSKGNMGRWRRYLDEEDDIDGEADGDIDDDDDFNLSETTPLRQSGHTIRRSRKNGGVALYSPHNYQRQDKERIYYIKLLIWLLTCVVVILGTGFIMGFVLASSKPLQQVHIAQVFDVVVSNEELAFTFIIEAVNPGLVGVSVDQVDLDLFAKSIYIDEPPPIGSPSNDNNKPRTMLLGNVDALEVPLTFEGGVLSHRIQKSLGDVRLLNPGRNVTGIDDGSSGKNEADKDPEDEGQKRWKRLNGHPFDLIVRGALKYKLFLGGKQSVSIAKTVQIDPS